MLHKYLKVIYLQSLLLSHLTDKRLHLLQILKELNEVRLS